MSLLIIIIYIFSLFVLVSLARGLSVLLIFFQRATCLSHWFFSIFCLHFYLFLLLHLLTLEFYSFLMYVFWGFPCSSAGKESTCNIGEPSLIPGLGRSAGEGLGHPLQYFWASLVVQVVKNAPAMWETWFNHWVGMIPWRREWLPTPVSWRILWTEEPELYSMVAELDTTEWLSLSLSMYVSTVHSNVLAVPHEFLYSMCFFVYLQLFFK